MFPAKSGELLLFPSSMRHGVLPNKYEEFAFLSYECKPLKTNYISAKEVFTLLKTFVLTV